MALSYPTCGDILAPKCHPRPTRHPCFSEIAVNLTMPHTYSTCVSSSSPFIPPVMLKNSDRVGRLRIVNFHRLEVVEYSRERIEDGQAVNGAKILCIPGEQREITIEGGGCDQGVWQPDAVLLPQRDRPLHHGLVK
jgi:hypothetical protein